MKMVYLGGAVDYGFGMNTHNWRHDLARIVQDVYMPFCPICANRQSVNDRQVMRVNEVGLLASERAVFLLDGKFTVGTPIEVAMRLAEMAADTICIVHPTAPGVFVRVWQAQGAHVVKSLDEVPNWLLSQTPSELSTTASSVNAQSVGG